MAAVGSYELGWTTQPPICGRSPILLCVTLSGRVVELREHPDHAGAYLFTVGTFWGCQAVVLPDLDAVWEALRLVYRANDADAERACPDGWILLDGDEDAATPEGRDGE